MKVNGCFSHDLGDGPGRLGGSGVQIHGARHSLHRHLVLIRQAAKLDRVSRHLGSLFCHVIAQREKPRGKGLLEGLIREG